MRFESSLAFASAVNTYPRTINHKDHKTRTISKMYGGVLRHDARDEEAAALMAQMRRDFLLELLQRLACAHVVACNLEELRPKKPTQYGNIHVVRNSTQMRRFGTRKSRASVVSAVTSGTTACIRLNCTWSRRVRQ